MHGEDIPGQGVPGPGARAHPPPEHGRLLRRRLRPLGRRARRASPAEGFAYVRGPEEDGRAVLRIEYGEVGWRVLQGVHASVAAFVEAGNDVVFDDMPLDAAALLDWRRALAGIPATSVLLDVPVDVLEQREAARDPKVHGLARGHVGLMAEVSDVDLRLDGTLPLDHLARQLVGHLALRGRTPGITLGLRERHARSSGR